MIEKIIHCAGVGFIALIGLIFLVPREYGGAVTITLQIILGVLVAVYAVKSVLTMSGILPPLDETGAERLEASVKVRKALEEIEAAKKQHEEWRAANPDLAAELDRRVKEQP